MVIVRTFSHPPAGFDVSTGIDGILKLYCGADVQNCTGKSGSPLSRTLMNRTLFKSVTVYYTKHVY